MKKIITLFTFCLCAGMLMAQTPALKVDANSNVGIKQASPQSELHISAEAEQSGFIVERTDGGATTNFVVAAAGAGGSGFVYKEDKIFLVIPGATVLSNAIDPTKQFSVHGADANVGIGTLAPATKLHVEGVITHGGLVMASDRKTKSNISKFNTGLEAVMNIQPIEYMYNGKGGTQAGAKHIGVIAQDLQKEVPQLVQEFQHANFGKSVSLDGKNFKANSTESVLRIKDNEIKYVLWNAIRDQQEIIDQKDAQIQDLLSRMESIEAKIAGLDQVEIEGTLSRTDGFLGQNNPNPFTETTTINYEVPLNATTASINVLDMSGRIVKTFDLDHTGMGSIKLSADDNVSGTYSYQLVVDGKMLEVQKMIIAR